MKRIKALPLTLFFAATSNTFRTEEANDIRPMVWQGSDTQERACDGLLKKIKGILLLHLFR